MKQNEPSFTINNSSNIVHAIVYNKLTFIPLTLNSTRRIESCLGQLVEHRSRIHLLGYNQGGFAVWHLRCLKHRI